MATINTVYSKLFGGLLIASALLIAAPSIAIAGGFEDIDNHIGNNESILLAAPDGNIVYSKNADQKMIPASTIKILTSLAAFHFLGKDYRFKTEFYLDDHQNLFIKGFGDPLLISEVVKDIAHNLAERVPQRINDLFVDDGFFSQPSAIPGVSSSLRSYNAPNGALCVNFNTVYFKRGHAPGTYVSAEPQTPLLPFALKLIEQAGQSPERIVLSHDQNNISLYAGQMFGFFLEKNGVKLHGEVRPGLVVNERCRLIMTHESPFTIEQICRKLLEHSNNFIANQLLMAIGAETHGLPGNIEKGVDAVVSYAATRLGTDRIVIVEGSGISRDNRICAKSMLIILEAFRPDFQLMKQEKNAFYKTGTLYGVSNLAGYIQNEKGRLYPFVIFINRTGKSAFPLMEVLMGKVS